MKSFTQILKEGKEAPPRAVCQEMIKAIGGDPEDMDLQYEVWDFIGDLKQEIEDVVSKSKDSFVMFGDNEPVIILKKFLWKHKAQTGPVLDVIKKYYRNTSYWLEQALGQGFRTLTDEETKDYPKHPRPQVRNSAP